MIELPGREREREGRKQGERGMAEITFDFNQSRISKRARERDRGREKETHNNNK